MLEKALESPLDCKETKPVNPKRNQSWVFIGRTAAEAEAPVLWPPDVMSWLIRKDPEVGKGWGQEEKGMIEDEMVGWHHWLNGHYFGQTPRDSEGQRSLVCCSPWGHKESDTTEWLNNNKYNYDKYDKNDKYDNMWEISTTYEPVFPRSLMHDVTELYTGKRYIKNAW